MRAAPPQETRHAAQPAHPQAVFATPIFLHMTPWVLITGGGLRLGREFCLAFARAGWNVACHYLRSSAAAEATCTELRALGVQAVVLQADLSDRLALPGLLDAFSAATGTLPTALVNNASTFEPDSAQDFHQDWAQVDRQLHTNTLAPLALAAEWANRLARTPLAGGASPVAIHVLDQKVHNLNPDYFSYTLSKLALERAVALQAQALAPGVRVVGISPGLMYPSGPQSEDNYQRAARVNLLRQPLEAAHVARSGVFLAENPAITGISLSVDNGQHLVPLARDVMFVVENGS